MIKKGTFRDNLEAGSHHISVITTTVAFARSRGFSMAEIEAVTGVEGAALGNPDARPPAEAAHRLWRALAVAEPEAVLGVGAARAASLSVLGGMMHGMQYADTLRDAIEFLVRNRAILGGLLEMELRETEDEALIVVR